MRYFLVSFTLTSRWSIGSVSFQCSTFFSKKFLLETIREQSPEVEDVCIISIFEFANQVDYDAYNI